MNTQSRSIRRFSCLSPSRARTRNGDIRISVRMLRRCLKAPFIKPCAAVTLEAGALAVQGGRASQELGPQRR